MHVVVVGVSEEYTASRQDVGSVVGSSSLVERLRRCLKKHHLGYLELHPYGNLPDILSDRLVQSFNEGKSQAEWVARRHLAESGQLPGVIVRSCLDSNKYYGYDRFRGAIKPVLVVFVAPCVEAMKAIKELMGRQRFFDFEGAEKDFLPAAHFFFDEGQLKGKRI